MQSSVEAMRLQKTEIQDYLVYIYRQKPRSYNQCLKNIGYLTHEKRKAVTSNSKIVQRIVAYLYDVSPQKCSLSCFRCKELVLN